MNRAGKEIMACRIAEALKDTLLKKETSNIPLPWKQDTYRRTAIIGKGETGPNMDASAYDTEKNQSLRMGRDNENCNTNSNSDISKSAISSNLTENSNDNKVMLPKRDKRCIKTKNEDFLWF